METSNKSLVLETSHNRTAGFFSNCSVRLEKIINFFNENNDLPQKVNSSKQFRNYKEDVSDLKEDLASWFFEQQNVQKNITKVQFYSFFQFAKYKDIDFKRITPFVEKYFSPSVAIKNIIRILEEKYLIDYENTCSVHYRGNDKCIETGISGYEEFFNKAKQILQQYPNIKFLIQTDELEFAAEFKQRFTNSFFFEELSMINHNTESSVHHSLPRDKRKEHASYFLAAIIIMSKTKHLITYSGNSGFWTVLYRGSAENVYQYLKNKNGKIKNEFN